MHPKNSFSTFASLFLVLIIDTMGLGLVLPVLAPLFIDAHSGMLSAHATTFTRNFFYGFTMAIFSVATFFGSPFMGSLSDRLGRKKVILLCLGNVTLGYLISAAGIYFNSLSLLTIGRIVCGFAAGSQPIVQAAIIDISSDENKVFNIGLITLACCCGFIIGPLFGGYFSSLLPQGTAAYLLPFLVAAGLAIINTIALQLFFSETHKPTNDDKINLAKSIGAFKLAYSLKPLRLLSVVYVLIQASWSMYFQFVSLYLIEKFHYSSHQLGLYLAYIGIIFSLSLTVIIRILLRFMQLYRLILLSLVLATGGLAASILFKTQFAQWISVLPIAIGIALSYAALMTTFSNRVDKSTQGLAMGITASLGSLSWVIGGLSIGMLTTRGFEFPFIVATAIMVVNIAFVVFDAKKYAY